MTTWHLLGRRFCQSVTELLLVVEALLIKKQNKTTAPFVLNKQRQRRWRLTVRRNAIKEDARSS